LISFSSVNKQYGKQLVFVDASFQLNPGEKVGLVGPNGSGKTTLFRMIVGDEEPNDCESTYESHLLNLRHVSPTGHLVQPLPCKRHPEGVRIDLVGKTKLPEDVREFFAREGAKGGKIGGKNRMDKLTPAQRTELARKAVAARIEKARRRESE
jgi:ABC-type cobalamin/Fe3+-siderophores transport system ATPase subunit